jgi:hypothetical protein
MSYDDVLSHHTLKEIATGREVMAYFVYKPTTTTDAFNLLVFKGVIYLSSPDHGAMTFMPFAPDALTWLERSVHDNETLIAAIPENLSVSFGEVTEDSVDFFLAALRRFHALRRREA